jgi:hypothetical protein
MISLTGGSMIFGGHFLSAARQANGERNLGVPTAKGFLVVPPRHIMIPSGKMTYRVPPVSEVMPNMYLFPSYLK